MKITLELTPAQKKQLYWLAYNTQPSDMANKTELKCYFEMCRKVVEATK